MMNMNNSNFFHYRGEAVKETSEAFVRNWWDPVFSSVNIDDKFKPDNAYFEILNGLYERFLKAWDARPNVSCECEWDPGKWLMKRRDPALLIPEGVLVCYGDKIGITENVCVPEGCWNWECNKVTVKFKGVKVPVNSYCLIPYNVQNGLIDIIRDQVINDIKCNVKCPLVAE